VRVYSFGLKAQDIIIMSFGKQPNSAYAKTFNSQSSYHSTATVSKWRHTLYENNVTLMPANNNANVYITNDLIVAGSLNNPSDIKLKENIIPIDPDRINNIMKLIPKQYNYKKDANKKIHYGFIAQEMEELIPELVSNINVNDNENENETENETVEEIKTINYLELIPLLVMKIQELENKINLLTQPLI